MSRKKRRAREHPAHTRCDRCGKLVRIVYGLGHPKWRSMCFRCMQSVNSQTEMKLDA